MNCPRDLAHRLRELAVRGVLDEIAVGAGLERPAQIGDVVVHRLRETRVLVFARRTSAVAMMPLTSGRPRSINKTSV